MLLADIVKAYRCWRLHNGTFQSYLETKGRQALVDLIEPWWYSWASNWIVNVHGAGFCNLFNDIRMARGNLSQETIEATKKSILDKDKDKGLVQLLISNHPPSAPFDYTTIQAGATVESCGCVWGGSTSDSEILSTDSIADLIHWIIDCDQHIDDSSYLEPGRSIYHSSKATKKNTKPLASDPGHAEPSSSQSENLTENEDSNRLENSENSTSSTTLSELSKLAHPSSLFNKFPHAAASTATAVAKGSLDGFNNLMYYSTFGLVNINKVSVPEETVLDGPTDDLNDSKFLIGFEGNLDEDEQENLNPGSETVTPSESNSQDDTTQAQSNGLSEINHEGREQTNSPGSSASSDSIDTSSTHLDATKFSYKRVLLSLNSSSNQFQPYNIVVFRRRPFIFTLVFTPQSTALSDKSYYLSLYRRLASLTEPMYSDLIPTSKKHDSTKSRSKSSLAPIPNNSQSSSNQPILSPVAPTYGPHSPSSLTHADSIPASGSFSNRKSSSASTNANSQFSKIKKFYYLVHDPNKSIIQYSLPEIISYQTIYQLASKVMSGEDAPEFQNALFKRDELIHVHQSMAHISLSRHKHESEKFIRTAKGWWVYWERLPDKRQVVLARKWNSPGKPPSSNPINGLINALGPDANAWLNEYKSSGLV